MSALPFMEDVTYAAHMHSMKWWFDAIANGIVQGSTREGPAPDGCLCDAATPCAPRTTPQTETCAWYKQGDGEVPRHDWTIEETLSGVMMMAEMLLISRNVTGAQYYLPLFLRTSELLESRRDPATGNTTFLTGPSTNLLAPSFAGGPNGTKSYLAGVSITYTAALNRLIELTKLTENATLQATFTQRRDLALAGLGSFLTTTASDVVAKAAADGDVFHGLRKAKQQQRKLADAVSTTTTTTTFEEENHGDDDQCTPAGELCGASAPSAPACCGNATCRKFRRSVCFFF